MDASRMSRVAHGFAAHLVRDPFDAEDVAQDALLLDIKRPCCFDVRTRVRNALAQRLQRDAAVMRSPAIAETCAESVDGLYAPARDADPCDVAIGREFLRMALRAMEKLPARQRAALLASMAGEPIGRHVPGRRYFTTDLTAARSNLGRLLQLAEVRDAGREAKS